MILKDATTDLLLKMEVFMAKRGQDINARRDLIQAINTITGEDSLDAIYINTTDNYLIPDVVVLPLYNKDFNLYLMDGDLSNTCPFGYTVEIHQRTFDTLTPEELTAVVIHDILQNVQSCSAKVRFMKAYSNVQGKYTNEDLLRVFDGMSSAEVMFMGFMDICTRPFRVPVMSFDYIGTDEVLKNMDLGDAYDSYLVKVLQTSDKTPEEYIEAETKQDYKMMKTILQACMNRDIRHYYTMVRNATPLVTLDNIFGTPGTTASLGFISRMRSFKHRYEPANSNAVATLSESFLNPKNELELRFQVDKIISDIRFAESEPEREVILIKIKNLSIKLFKLKDKYDKRLQTNPTDNKTRDEYEFVCNLLDELELLRQKTVKMDIKEKRYGVFVQYPKGYEYGGSPVDNYVNY
ncbi:hypothetical protein [uncultured Duncaniella sp.]|uniref:hypothetical protein n=1 Tax=uncultured Duncaniella sp. TaxID=2768039 RepID=UPI002615BFDB|nr:hypothetical protein [uncultured Duncaniella sp.]